MLINGLRGAARSFAVAIPCAGLLMPVSAFAQASSRPGQQQAPSATILPALDDATWNVRTFRRKDSPRDAPVGRSAPMTIVFAGERVSGSSGCNTYRGLARRRGRTIEIGPLATTRKACTPAVMTQEQGFIAAMSSATTWRIRQSTLELLSATGGRLVTARRGAAPPPASPAPGPATPEGGAQPPADGREARLVGPVWRLVSLERWTEHDAALRRAGITARFSPGSVVGHAGCNRYRATAQIDGARLVVRGIVGTLMACPDLELEQAFKQAMGQTERFEIKDGRLLVTYERDKVMTFALEAPPRLLDLAWNVLFYNNGRQAVVSVKEGAVLTMRFEFGRMRESSAIGRVSGSAGCNSFTGTFESSGSTLAIRGAVATRKTCAEAGVMAQEQQFLAALGTVASWRVVDGKLELRTADDALAISGRAAP